MAKIEKGYFSYNMMLIVMIVIDESLLFLLIKINCFFSP